MSVDPLTDQFPAWSPYNFVLGNPVWKFRQSVIAHLLKSRQDLRVIQAFTCHKCVSSVEEYRQTGLEELKATIKKHHPLIRKK